MKSAHPLTELWIIHPGHVNSVHNIRYRQPGYLETVRAITERYGTLLIFDEVKTGITAGYGGATGELGVAPDLITLAKSIGGGSRSGLWWQG